VMVKINCQGVEPKKAFVIDGLSLLSTLGALKSHIEEHTSEGTVTLNKAGKQLAFSDVTSLKRAGIKDGDTVTFTVKNEPKVKVEEKKQVLAPVEPKDQKKEVEEETQAETYGLDLGMDFRHEKNDVDLETEIDEWNELEFGELEKAIEGEREERETEDDDKLPEPFSPFSPDAITDEEALPQMAPPKFIRQTSYVILGKIEITQRQKDVLDQVVDTLELAVSRAVMLLRVYDWQADECIQAYKENPVAALKKAGVSEEELKKDQEAKEGKTEEKTTDQKEKEKLPFYCESCMTETDWKDTFSLEGCSHRYCNDCWKGWCDAAFDKGQECVFTECIFGNGKTKCHELLPPETIKKHLDVKKQDKFQEWLNISYVKTSKNVKWCPRPGCDKAVEYKRKGMKKVVCACGYSFCFGCGQEDHEPAPCDGVKDWLKKCNAESDIFKWIEENKENKEVKNCTKCHIVIEKNQGCMHMTCRNCRHEFCWLCFQDWHGHDSNLCTQYQSQADNKLVKERQGEESGNEFRRYQFYYTRWDVYRKSIAFAERIKETAEKRMEALQAMKGVSLSGVKFLLDAVETVIACRKLLQWSYVWSYILKDQGVQKDLFRHHLGALEEFTEELGALTEQPLDKLMLDIERTDVINKTRVINKYRQNIIDFALENHTKLETISPDDVPTAPPM